MTAADVVWVVPCFDEAARIDLDALLKLVDDDASPSLILVDDGSRDQTLLRLRALADRRPERISVIALPHNQGKAEAIRQGMLQALAGPADVVGFADADLATPLAELRRLAELLCQGDHDVVLGSRVQLLGRSIRRRALRHYMGRFFATCASLSLGLAVYDTQCGAKVFRRTPALAAAIAKPFESRWAFDVELLGRLLRPGGGAAGVPTERVWEEPLHSWSDVPGSKLSAAAGLKATFELARIGWQMRRRSRR